MDIDSLLGALDGDQLDIDFTPTNYTPDAVSPAEADDADDLTAHLQGIDTKLAEIDNIGTEQADTTFTISSSAHYIEIDTSGGAVTATLPSAATLGAGWSYVIKVTDNTNLTTLATNGAETIEGASAWAMSYDNEVLELMSDGTNWKILRWNLPIETERGIFTYADATSYTVGSACYRLPSSLFQKVYWRGTLTLGPSTWAAGSTAITTTGWHYLYLDQSAIDAGSSPIIQDSHFLSSTTAPSYDTTYHGYYNGNDRCIFAVRFSAASTLVEFFHFGDRLVLFADAITDRAAADLDTVWTKVTLSIPVLCRKAMVTFLYDANSQTTDLVWRINGQTGTTGHYVGIGSATVSGDNYNTAIVITGPNQKIEVRTLTAVTAGCAVYADGWFLPKGM
jgi:hypothetical protein